MIEEALWAAEAEAEGEALVEAVEEATTEVVDTSGWARAGMAASAMRMR